MHFEDEFFKGKKLYRKERKIARAKDRSKFKKTDLEKKEKHHRALEEGQLRGRVLAILPENIIVDVHGKQYVCILRGVLKKEKTKQKNLVAVGDFVHFIPHEKGLSSILYIEPRKSILSRAEHLTRHKEQIIAVNIDQVFITCSLFIPRLKPPLIDRYIIAARKGNMEPIIIINKIDLLKHPPENLDKTYIEEEKQLFKQIKEIYTNLRIPFFPVSTITGEGIDQIKNIMREKSSVFSGQSGVGKTALINAVIGTDLKVGELIEKTKKGMHTTTRALLLPLEDGGFCIDTPGIRSFGIWELSLDEIKTYFHEIATFGQKCYFPNCSHIHEPDCCVKQAVKQGKISPLRYHSYLTLMKKE